MTAAWALAGLMTMLALAMAWLFLRAKRRVEAGAAAAPAEADELTGLYGRKAFYAQARQTIMRHPDCKYLVVVCDIDRFKVYNDLFGTQEGDKLLAGLGKAMQGMNGERSVVGRMQADNFAVLCPEDDFDAQRDLGRLAQWFKNYRDDYTFSLSAGIYQVTDPTLDIGLMCDRAMLASGTVKHGYGFKHAYYDQSLRQRMVLEQEIVGQMAQALEAGEFQVYYQPQYSFSTGKVVGAEALVRWVRPDGKMINPGVFIPIFEKNGFITRLDEYVWEQVCRQMRAWSRLPYMADIPVSVNVSRMDIYNPNLPEHVHQLAEKYGIPVSKLRLEITESCYVDNPVQLIEAVKRLQSMGFFIEMDDFGSGYSSLNTLKDVPVDLLKLDLKFLSGENNAKGGNILSSVVRMAHWLRLPVVAEGVETRQQAEFLLSIGCDYMQGFFFARPMPAQRFEEIMRESAMGKITRGEVYSATLDANQFWNPDSQATLIFNSYVGGAAIYEYSPGRLEVLRINREYLKVIHMGRAEYEPYRKNVLDRFYEKDRDACEQMFIRALESGRGECELHCRPGPGQDGEGTWIYMRVQLLSKGQSRSIFYALVEETTRQRALSEQLSAIMESVPGGIAMYHVKDNIKTVFFNDAVAQMSHMTRQEYLAWAGEDAMVAVHPEDRAMVAAKVRAMAESPQINRMEVTFRILRKDGGFYWVQLSASVMRREGEEFVASAVLLDITEAVQTRKHAQQQNRALLRLYDTVPCGIMRYSPTGGNVSFVNSRGLEMLGYKRGQIFAKTTKESVMQGIYPEDRDYYLDVMKRVMTTQDTVDFEHRIQRPDGQVLWVRGSAGQVTDEDGQVGIQSIFYNCTAERTLQQERTIAQYSRVLMSVFDEVFLINYVDRTCRTLFSQGRNCQAGDSSRPLDEALDTWINTWVHPSDRDVAEGMLRQYHDAQEAQSRGGMYRIVHPHNRITFCQTTTLTMDKANVLVCNRDVSQRVRAEEALKENARLLGAQWEQERYRIIVEHTGAAVVEWNRDQDGVYRSPNLQAYAISQVDGTALFTLQALEEAVAPTDQAAVREFWDQLRAGGAKAAKVMRLKMVDGSYRWSNVSGYIVRDQQGKLIRIVGTVVDMEDAVNDRREKEALANRMEAIIASLPVGVAIYEMQPDRIYLLYMSEQVLEIAGYQRDQVYEMIRQRQPIRHDMYLDGPEALERWLKRGARGFDRRFEFHRADGQKRWVHVQGNVKNKDGRALCYVVFTDISDQVRGRQVQRWRDERFRIVNAMNRDVIFDYEPDIDRLTIFTGQSDSQEQVMEHYRRDYLEGGSSGVAKKSRGELLRALELAEAGQAQGSLEFKGDLGYGVIWYRGNWVSVKDEAGRVAHVVGRVEDIRRERALKRKAEYDEVTGLYNRSTTWELAQRVLDDAEQREQCVFVVLDVDDFKEINDTYGHLRGDQLLRAVGQLLRGSFRAQDVAGRVGGDEFALLLRQIPLEVALDKLNGLVRQVHGLAGGIGIDAPVSLSIGLYPVNGDDLTVSQVFEKADAALYAAKRQGKDNCQVYHPGMEMGEWPQG